MKGMASTPDYYVPPDEGPHNATVISATPGLSKKGNTQITIQVQLDGTSEVIDDYLGTQGGVKGAGMSKAKLRGLGIDVSTDAEVPDEEIAAQLLNRKCIIEIEHENSQRKDDAGNYVNATHFDERTGQTIQLKRARAKGFRMANVGGMAKAPAQMQQAPQQYAQPVQFAPTAQPPMQYAQAPQQQYAAAQPQFAPPVQQYAQAPQQYAQPPFAQQMQQPAPQPQYAQPAQQQMQYAPPPQLPVGAPVQFQQPPPPAPVPWQTGAGAPGTDPTVNGAAEAPKKKRKSNISDEAQG
jgi:hypothetical protein